MTTLVLAPSLGTESSVLWSRCRAALPPELVTVYWDLPGHGPRRPEAVAGCSIASLAQEVLDSIDGPLYFAGDSVGGAIGLQIALDAPDRLEGLAVICSAAKIGEAEAWRARARTVEWSGVASMVSGSAERWFAPGFADREPAFAAELLDCLVDTSTAGYAAVCRAIAEFDVRSRVREISVPLLAIAGTRDVVCPPEQLGELVQGSAKADLVVLDDVGHLAPAEAPAIVAGLLAEHLASVKESV